MHAIIHPRIWKRTVIGSVGFAFLAYIIAGPGGSFYQWAMEKQMAHNHLDAFTVLMVMVAPVIFICLLIHDLVGNPLKQDVSDDHARGAAD